MIVRRLISFVVGLLVFATIAIAQPETTVETTKLSKTLFHLKVTTFYPVSTLASIGPDGILLVDPGMEQSSDVLMKTLAGLSKEDVKVVINTHSHDHHTSMNKMLGGKAEIYAHAASVDLMKSDLDVLVEWPKEAFPSHTIVEETSFVFNGEEIRLIPMVGGHGKDDILVYFPESKVACTGGVLKSGSYPMVDYARGGDFRGFPELARKALNRFPEDVTFVQSHGDNFDYKGGLDYVERIEKSIPLIKKAFSEGKDSKAMIGEDILAQLADDESAYPSRNYWIRTVYQGLSTKNNGIKSSLTAPLFYALKNGRGADAVKVYQELKQSSPDDYGFNEGVLNMLGYFLLGKDRIDDAIIIFKLNVKEYPDSFNVYDSLGEAFMSNGNMWRAKYNYRKSLRINPENENGKQMLEKIKG